MEKIGGPDFEEGREIREKGIIGKLKALAVRSGERRRTDKLSLVLDLLTFVIGLVFARCHVVFGAHPLSIAFVAALPSRVFLGAAGSAIGALTLGKAGIVYAMIALIVVFLRMVVSESDGGGELFSESLLLRMCTALIGGFVGAAYEVLLSGFTFTSVLFGAAMIFFSPLLCFLMSGFLDSGYSIRTFLFLKENILSLKGKEDREKYALIFFALSGLVFIFLLSISLAEYVVFGINISYITASFLTILTARRFGAIPALAVGFATSFGLSGLYSVAFALLGVTAGLLFPIGPLYALAVGGAVMCAWCAYTGGVGGFLSTLPEYAVSALLSMPVITRISPEGSPSEKEEDYRKETSEMLGVASLSYKNRYTGSLDALESTLSVLASIIKGNVERGSHLGREEILEVIEECIENYMLHSHEDEGDSAGEISKEAKDVCVEKLAAGYDIDASDLTADGEDIPLLVGLADSVNRAVAALSEEKFRYYKKDTAAEDMSLISALLTEARGSDEREKSVNEKLTEGLKSAVAEMGLECSDARVFGTRRPCFLIACRDERGEKITKAELKEKIEALAGVKLDSTDYYKNGSIALLEAKTGKRFFAECAALSKSGSRERISGDTHRAIESKDARFYTMICDGMGSGREAREISDLASEILSRTLWLLPFPETLLAILNHLVTKNDRECSVTVDLFSLDLVTGKGAFIKSGAAASYVKRGDSLYRIRSHTAPLGLMRELDSELIKVDVEDGDYIIMLSDGVSQNVEDSPWLYSILSSTKKKDVKELAAEIMEGAKKNSDTQDDMTVTVTKINSIR